MGRRKGKKKAKATRPPFKRQELHHDALRTIIERASSTPLSDTEKEQLLAAVDTLAFLTQELEKKGTTITRLRKMVFGPTSEKSKDVVDEPKEQEGKEEEASSTSSDQKKKSKEKKAKKKRKGHGRHGVEDYPEAEHIAVAHPTLQPKARCPLCQKGKVYEQNDPAVLVRVIGIAPLSATVYEKQRLRCNLCGEVFTAPTPEGVGDKKYDETAATMIALLKYGCGLPFYRIEKLGGNLKIPLPSSTQWEVVEEAAHSLEAVWAELVRQAAQGKVVYIDDTKMKILALNTELQKALEEGEKTRTGIFTSGIVSTREGHEIALFFTGNKHAGENLEALLQQREEQCPPPIQMSDALACNTSGDFETIVAHCLVHARRHFVDLVDSFPEEVRYVLEELGEVYKHDAEAKSLKMSDEERLRFHQEKSEPVMDRLKGWLEAQFEQKRIEPNSTLGGAIQYMQNHWEELTLFLRVAGAPLDNNITERTLKRAILHRKNSLFYKTEKGAMVGDIWMSLIHSAEMAGENPFEYLVELQRHHSQTKESPADWMPWNYKETLARLQQP